MALTSADQYASTHSAFICWHILKLCDICSCKEWCQAELEVMDRISYGYECNHRRGCALHMYAMVDLTRMQSNVTISTT